jgi:hypothetical protein
MFVVPKGVEHKPYAEQEVKLFLIEPRGSSTRTMKAATVRPRMTSGFDEEWWSGPSSPAWHTSRHHAIGIASAAR